MLLVIEIFLYFSCLIFLLLWECFAVMYINDIFYYICVVDVELLIFICRIIMYFTDPPMASLEFHFDNCLFS
jgi:hypothetical protein